MATQLNSSFWRFPSTRLGWWAVGLAAVFVAIFISILARTDEITAPHIMPYFQDNPSPWWIDLLPFFANFMMGCGLASGVVGLIAVVREHERSWLVWLTILPLVGVLFLLLAEFLALL